ncbi:MAG: hypothetical protein ACK55I_50785, partial [bacterium]
MRLSLAHVQETFAPHRDHATVGHEERGKLLPPVDPVLDELRHASRTVETRHPVRMRLAHAVVALH